ncbi:MAG: hypothetical protein FWF15_04440 [Oscillospiraceae bacterium]|nr:hypothetical protein [Oscillospiraceae bacterium]
MYFKNNFVKRLFFLAICVFFIAGALLSAAFIFTYIHHEHDYGGFQGNCGTCAHLLAVENLLKYFFCVISGAAFGIGCFTVTLSILKSADFYTAFSTLVLLKVRFNN